MTQEKRKWRVAIAGCHRMVTRTPGSHNFAAAFYAVPEVQVVGVFDFGGEARAEFAACWRDVWGDVPTYDDYERMLAEIRPDLLCIATRQTMHADQIELAVQSGVRGILCDKPLATSLEELDRISAACGDVPLLFALDRRWSGRYRYLRQQLADGIIGPVTSITAYGLSNLINHGCHWYDTLLALAGDIAPDWVSGFVEDISGEPAESRKRLDPSGRAQIGLSNGAVLYITPDGAHKGPGLPMSFEVVGENGRLFLLNDATESFVWRENDPSNMRQLEIPQETEPWPAGKAMAEDLINAVGSGERTACDIKEASPATEIGFAIHLSAQRQGAQILLPAETRSLQIKSFPWGSTE